MFRDLAAYPYGVVGARHHHDFNVPTIADWQHFAFDLSAIIDTTSANGNVLDLIDYIEQRGNGNDPLIKYHGADIAEIHQTYCHSVARNEAFVDDTEKFGRFVLPFPTHRKRWQTMTLRVQFNAADAVDPDATDLTLVMEVTQRHGPVPWSIRVKSQVEAGTDDVEFDLPTDQGLVEAFYLMGTTDDNIQEIWMTDRWGQNIVDSFFQRARSEMQYWLEATDVAGNWCYVPVPVTAASKNVYVKINQTASEDVRCYCVYRAGTVQVGVEPTTEQAARGQRPQGNEVYVEFTKYEEQLSMAKSGNTKVAGTQVSPG